jgi:hypothetical protein
LAAKAIKLKRQFPASEVVVPKMVPPAVLL